jgi:RNA polymerase sigma-70 factor (ECF subfamily)
MAEPTPDSDETRRLFRQIEAGELGAFDRLFARHRPELCRFIDLRLDSRLRARVDASDVAQETHLEAYRRLPDYLQRKPMPFQLWLRKTAYERLLMLRRQHVHSGRRSVGREVPLPERSSVLLARQAGSTPSQQLERKEVAQRVQQALDELADIDREVLLLRNYEGQSYQEIAWLLDIDAATARKRHGRALVRLHRLLVEGHDPES